MVAGLPRLRAIVFRGHHFNAYIDHGCGLKYDQRQYSVSATGATDMKRHHCLTLLASVLLVTTNAAADEHWTFANAEVGTVPSGWITGVTGSKQGKPPRWEVVRDGGKSVLAQLESGGARNDFPICLKRGSSLKNGTVSVRFKPISGQIDQAGGVVFRAKDEDNFYIARANALENNVSVYVTHKGKRKTIKYWDNIDVALGKWHELTVQAKGFTFTVSLNGKLIGTVEDRQHIFPDAGMVGVWTKADSVTYFDKLSVTSRIAAVERRLIDFIADAGTGFAGFQTVQPIRCSP